MITVAPPVVQPSLGLMALMQGVAERKREREKDSTQILYNITVTIKEEHLRCQFHLD